MNELEQVHVARKDGGKEVFIWGPPRTDRQTDMTENIAFPQTTLQACSFTFCRKGQVTI